MYMYGYDCSRLTIHLHNNNIIGRSNTAAVVAGVVVPLLLLALATGIILSVIIYVNVNRKQSATLRNEQIETVNETFSVDSPDQDNIESDDGTVSKGEDADSPDEHASVPKPEKTPIQKTLLEDLSAFV